MHNTGLSKIHSCFNVFSEKLPMTWYVLAIVVHRWDLIYRVGFQHQANGIDRPSFGATVIKNRSKHGLSELEQSWLVGEIL